MTKTFLENNLKQSLAVLQEQQTQQINQLKPE